MSQLISTMQLPGSMKAGGYRQQPHVMTTEKWILMLY